ncbi:Vomeronasal type-1 receptor 2 [Fukomys damarensis]|uniref:Vomeronasal type-1 receptor n=1 Tax=Fukomys damarensis TaxID=885580 RepID=A0A091ELP3_FUKDA|nr:Vomeronasal type-1 receptor 2 [Fukomys damarensis]
MTTDLKFGILFLFQIVIGTTGNLSLLFHYISLQFSGNKTRSADVILRHLTMANSLVILSRGIPETMASFGVKQFLSDAGCKLVFYAHNVGKGVSIDSTCLLTLFQAISISPRRSVWAELKVKALRYISSSTVFCWVLQMLLNIRLPIILTNNNSKRNITKTIDFQYCSAGPHDRDPGSVFAVLRLSHDVLCLALMIWASGSMVFILFRHKQRVHHLHRHSSCRSSPETRASQSILILVSAFVFFYTLSSTLHVCMALTRGCTWWLVTASAFINACFPFASPFILLSREHWASRFIWKK